MLPPSHGQRHSSKKRKEQDSNESSAGKHPMADHASLIASGGRNSPDTDDRRESSRESVRPCERVQNHSHSQGLAARVYLESQQEQTRVTHHPANHVLRAQSIAILRSCALQPTKHHSAIAHPVRCRERECEQVGPSSTSDRGHSLAIQRIRQE